MSTDANASMLESSRRGSLGFTGTATAEVLIRDGVAGPFANLWAAIRNLQGEAIAHGLADQCCSEELKMTVPLSARVMVGQRYEVALENRDPILGSVESMVDGQYATVFRTEVVKQPGGQALCVGLRFDQPVML